MDELLQFNIMYANTAYFSNLKGFNNAKMA